MCLILFAVNPSPEQLSNKQLPDAFKTCPPHLIVAANRDEFHQRPSADAHYWQDNPDLLAGRDLEAGGTWLGVSRGGRFAAVTNFAERLSDPIPPLSRGKLTSEFLAGTEPPKTYLEGLIVHADQYRGFNLLVSDGHECFYLSNREKQVRKLESGFYGLSNQLLDCDWPKVIQGRAALAASDLSPQALLAMLAETDDSRAHLAKFIVGEQYGTRTSSIVHLNRQDLRFEEQNFDQHCQASSHNLFELDLI